MTGNGDILREMVDCPNCELGLQTRYIGRTNRVATFKCIVCDGSGKLLMGRIPFHVEKSDRHRRPNRRT